MKNAAFILSSLIMILFLCGSSPDTLSPESAAAESPAPLQQPEPSPGPESSPTPSPEGSIFDLMAKDPSPSPAYQVDMAAYYLEEMICAAREGKTKAGHTAEENRRAAIEASGLQTQEISFDDLYLLARLIFSEAGSDWLDQDFRICVGEVVLNRVASPEFPDSLYEVVYQKGQYPVVSSPGFSSLKPGEDCVDAALRLLQGERLMVPSVVYQSDSIQGELFSMYSDRRLGNTYFCLSPNLELYPID